LPGRTRPDSGGNAVLPYESRSNAIGQCAGYTAIDREIKRQVDEVDKKPPRERAPAVFLQAVSAADHARCGGPRSSGYDRRWQRQENRALAGTQPVHVAGLVEIGMSAVPLLCWV